MPSYELRIGALDSGRFVIAISAYTPLPSVIRERRTWNIVVGGGAQIPVPSEI